MGPPRALTLLRDAPASTQLAEKGHGPYKTVRRDHKLLEQRRWLERAFVHLNAPLFRASKEELKVVRMQNTYQDLMDGKIKQYKMSGKMLFMSDLCAGRVRAPDELADGGPEVLLEHHHRLYGELAVDEKQTYQRRAVAETHTRQRRFADKAAHLLSKIHDAEHQLQLVRGGHQNTIRSCRYPDRYRQRLVDFVNTLKTSRNDTSFCFGRELPPRRSSKASTESYPG